MGNDMQQMLTARREPVCFIIGALTHRPHEDVI